MEPRDGLLQLLAESGIESRSAVALRLTAYLELLQKWNRRINLTASGDWSQLRPFFEEAIWAAGLYPAGAVSHLDIGSGAGFPAVPIRILVPGIHSMDLVESRVRKTAFLETVAAELKLAGIRVHPERLDTHLRRSEMVWDCVTWKGIRLGESELLLLGAHAHAGTQFWIFHGRDVAVEDSGVMEQAFGLLRREKFPSRREWHLSIYRAK
jgi:16S rRNA (guanine(527)-N(7))-methyltransferase RsmG